VTNSKRKRERLDQLLNLSESYYRTVVFLIATSANNRIKTIGTVWPNDEGLRWFWIGVFFCALALF